jgi:hypothetical protein
MAYTYEINPRPAALGGGLQVRLLDEGEEVGGSVFSVVFKEVAGIAWWNELNNAERTRRPTPMSLISELRPIAMLRKQQPNG